MSTVSTGLKCKQALVAGGIAAGWFITSRGAAGSDGGQVTDSQSVGGVPDSGQMPPDAKQVPEDQLQGGGEVTFSSWDVQLKKNGPHGNHIAMGPFKKRPKHSI